MMRKFEITVRCFEDENNSNTTPFYGNDDSAEVTCIVIGADDYGRLLNMMIQQARIDLALKEEAAKEE